MAYLAIFKVNKKGKGREIKASSIIRTDWRIERFHLIIYACVIVRKPP